MLERAVRKRKFGYRIEQMKCRLCHRSADWLRRRCATCASLWEVYETNRGAPLHVLLPLFEATGATSDHVGAFLAGDPDGSGAVQDRIAADMANQLFEAFGGTKGIQTADGVRRLRARGAWKSFGQRPE